MVNIRKARVEDALQIAIVNVYTWKTQYSGLMPEDVIDNRVANVEQMAMKNKQRIIDDDNYIVAEVDGTIVGFTRYAKSTYKDYENAGEIFALYLLKGFNGKGIGRKLFEAAKDELKRAGYNKMIIKCLKGNPTLDFYKYMGGKVIGEDKMIIDNAVLEEDVLMYNI
ncbi:MAG: GNAT family N-acetyltransferase [Clostridia bacterium]|nr:GNAT family N-acetyltransferase [Clostridia bacterium]